MTIQYKVVEDKRVFINKLDGRWSTQQYLFYFHEMNDIIDWKKVDFVFADMRGVSAKLSIKEITKLATIRKQFSDRNYTNIILVDSPLITALASMYQKLQAQNGFRCKFYSTLQGVAEGLNSRLSEPELHAHLASLSNFQTIQAA